MKDRDRLWSSDWRAFVLPVLVGVIGVCVAVFTMIALLMVR